MKTVQVFTALLLVFSLLCGCAALQPEQNITCGELTMTLPGSFADWSEDAAAEGLAFNYASDAVGVCGTFEDKTYLQSYIPGLDAQGYAELFVESNGLNSTVDVVDGIPSFTYTTAGSPSLRYLCGVFESGENFWVVQAYCASVDFEDAKGDMWTYITSITID